MSSLRKNNSTDSSSSDVTKNIKKRKKMVKRTNKHKLNELNLKLEPEVLYSPMNCLLHNSIREFICRTPNCLKELCGHCILSHKEHISHIVDIRSILKEVADKKNKVSIISPTKMLSEINVGSKTQISQLQEFEDQLKSVVTRKFEGLKNQVYYHAKESTSLIEGMKDFKEKAQKYINNNTPLDSESFKLVKMYLQFCEKISPKPTFIPLQLTLHINDEFLVQDFDNSIRRNISISDETHNLESTTPNKPKILHWFEWGKKKLNIFDIFKNTTENVELEINFKIPSFSRSLVIPSGRIYLLGGEEPEYFSRKEVYMYDHALQDNKLYQKANMPHKKFDFTVCYLNGFIYVICGKDSSSDVMDTCEKYDVEADQWFTIQSANKKRYAASAVGALNGKIYLFGGRTDFHNQMVHEIEEYSVDKNEWNIVTLRSGGMLWNPVEVCACIPIHPNKILIFGGSDVRIKDSNLSIVFDTSEFSIEKKGELKKPQVFVTGPFLYGRNVYAIGNEYYMKHRNLHRFNLDSEEWQIIF